MVRLHSPITPGGTRGLVLKSFAKLNLYLEVLNKRKDGYHNIMTVFERINLADNIILKPAKDGKIRISSSNADVPEDETNLCFRAAKLLQDEFCPERGIDIRIIKRIPVGAGMGGGSGNAAAVLKGLNRLWRLGLKRNKLAKLAEGIGCDVPFFVYDASFAKAGGRGDKIKPIEELKELRIWHVIIMPEIKVSTPHIYREWDRLSRLTAPKYDVNILISALKGKRLSLLRDSLYNGLEQVTFQLYPEVRRIKKTLVSLGVEPVLMSGSGPAVFGILASKKDALLIMRKLAGRHLPWRVFTASTF